jgi:arginyl-tRNA synthetase
MKEKLSDLLKTVIADLFDRDDLLVEIVKTKSEVHGDWSSNIAMILANELQENPKELARKIISSLP